MAFIFQRFLCYFSVVNIDFSFTEEQELFRKSVREFCEKQITLFSNEIEEKGEIPCNVREYMASFGLVRNKLTQGNENRYCLLMQGKVKSIK